MLSALCFDGFYYSFTSMDKSPLTKDEYTTLLIKGLMQNYVVTHQLVKPGERFTFAQLFNITKQDLVNYFAKNGYPPFNEKAAAKPPMVGDYETVWTFENWEYRAVWLEKGTTTTLFSTHSKVEFQNWWNENLLKEYEFQLTYPWSG